MSISSKPIESTSRDCVSRVVAHLESAILHDALVPGDLLPPERELCAQLGVSRGVVREALVQLARDELVCRRHGSGTRVARPSARPVQAGLRRLLSGGAFDWRDLGAARLSLEMPLTRLAARRRTDEHLNNLRRQQRVLRDTTASPDARDRAYVAFHCELATASGNLVFEIMLRPILEQVVLPHCESEEPRVARYGAAEHAKIVAAVERHDARLAQQAVRRHIARLHGRRSNWPDRPTLMAQT